MLNGFASAFSKRLASSLSLSRCNLPQSTKIAETCSSSSSSSSSLLLSLSLSVSLSLSLSAGDFYCYEPYLFTKTELGHAAVANTHTHHGRSKTFTISGEKKFSEPGKKQAATKRASSLSGVQPLRGFKRSEKPKKKKQ
jgi:hypothetical protein